MSSDIGKKDVATSGSGHGAVGTPAINNNPPPPPAGPAPVPYVYASKSSSADGTDTALEVGGDPVLVKGSTMEMVKPGDTPAKPTVGDVVTATVCGVSVMQSGSASSIADGKQICVTTDAVTMNEMTKASSVSQVNTVLLGAADFAAAVAAGAGGAGGGKHQNTAVPPDQANQPGGASGPPAPAATTEGEPVDVATGAAVDSEVDFALPGVIPLVFGRSYSTLRNQLSGSLGKGGWVHTFEQWISREDTCLSLRDGDGRDIWFAIPAPGETTFHRRERLELTADKQGGFHVYSLGTRLTRRFAALTSGGRAGLRRIEDAWGNAIQLDYEGERLARIVDTAGRQVVLRGGERGRVQRVEIWAAGELHQWIDLAYHPEGELASVTDALGFAQRYAYDGHHRLVETTLKNGTRFWHRYDAETGWCVKTWGEGGIHSVELYPDLRKRTTLVGGTAEPKTYTWNDKGVVVRQATHDGSFVREKVFDDDLNLLAETNAAGETTRYTYDEHANPARALDAAGNETTWEYVGDRPLRRIAPGGLVTTYTHDARGELTDISYPSASGYTVAHDGRGRLSGVYATDGQIFAYDHDDQHNLMAEADARGARTAYSHDPLGRPITRTDTLGRVTRIDYDRLGQPITITRPDGTRSHTEYDAMGAPSRVTDALGRETRLTHGGTGVLQRLVQADGHAYRFEYDASERLRKITNPRFEEYEFAYDRTGRIEREKTFDGRELRYQYNKAERLSRIDYPDATYRSFQYDPLGNVIAEQSPHGGINHKRNERGWLLESVLDEHGGKIVNRFERDALGRVIAEHQNDRTIRHEIDARGRRSARSLHEGATTRYGYDALGAASYVEHEGHRVTIERDQLGRETKRRSGRAGVEIASTYDEMNRLREQRVSAPVAAGDGARAMLVERRYAYDALGRVRQIQDGRWGTTVYEYDRIGQLIEARRGNLREAFEYDPTGSLQNVLASLDQIGHVKQWGIGTGNVLKEADRTRYENDQRGRRVKKIEVGPQGQSEETRYLWDCRDRLREVRLPSGDRVLFTYDAFARRVRKEVISAERPAPVGLDAEALRAVDAPPEASMRTRRVVDFVWDGDALASDVEGGRERVFVCEPGTVVPMLQAEGGDVFTVVNDHLGMPKELVDHGGKIVWAASHSVWGRLVRTWNEPRTTGKGSSPESPFRLLGQYADLETGLCYTQFRYFDLERGRWCSPDPLGLFGGNNPFGFDGSPTTHIDPLGLCALRRKQTPFMYYAEVPEDNRYRISMEVDEDGKLKGYIRGSTEGPPDKDGKPTDIRHPAFNAKKEYLAAGEHFKGQYNAIKGQWEFGTNLGEINRLTTPQPDGPGLTIEQAARQTWTGARARELGFPEPHEQTGQTAGQPGHYTKVVVDFKPKPAK
jgi:RHS repeat-associated protein